MISWSLILKLSTFLVIYMCVCVCENNAMHFLKKYSSQIKIQRLQGNLKRLCIIKYEEFIFILIIQHFYFYLLILFYYYFPDRKVVSKKESFTVKINRNILLFIIYLLMHPLQQLRAMSYTYIFLGCIFKNIN